MNTYRYLSLFILLILASSVQAEMSTNQLRGFANEVNRRVPMMMDEYTRLDGADAGKNLLTYKFTLLNVQIHKVNVRKLESKLAIQVIKNVCNRLQVLIKRGVTIQYYYRDVNGQKLTQVAVDKVDCGY